MSSDLDGSVYEDRVEEALCWGERATPKHLLADTSELRILALVRFRGRRQKVQYAEASIAIVRVGVGQGGDDSPSTRLLVPELPTCASL